MNRWLALPTIIGLSVFWVVACTDVPPRPSIESASASCPVTPLAAAARAPNVGWQDPVWQQAAQGLWAAPYFNVPVNRADPGPRAFKATEPAIKILWLTQTATNEALSVTVESFDGLYRESYVFEPPGIGRQDRPTGFSMPPPGCYRFSAQIGVISGEVVDQVVP